MQPLILTSQQARLADQRAVEQWGMSSLVLMENAGRGAAASLCEQEPSAQRIIILCGKGNNGGDGLVMARHLHLRSRDVQVILLDAPSSFSKDMLTNFHLVEKCDIPTHFLDTNVSPDCAAQLDQVCLPADCIVDAMLGTGTSGAPRPPLDLVIRWINQLSIPTISLDLPSGMNCDTGAILVDAVQADRTYTFAAAKPGLLLPSAAPHVGQLEILDIGLPRSFLEACIQAVPEEP